MRNGIHRNLPASEVRGFRSDLLLQAKDDGVALDITETPNGDGTVTIEWKVASPDATPSLKPSVNPDLPSSPPVANMDSPERPPAGPPSRFISARRSAQLTVVYVDAEGQEIVRQGGSRSWRNNNPGNIRKGDFALNHRAIGDDGSFAIFPDEEIGLAAVIGLFRTPAYNHLTLRDAIFRYAPPVENDSDRYLRFVVTQTRIPETTRVNTLDSEGILGFAVAIQKMEGWKLGTESASGPASGTVPVGEGRPGGISAAAGAVEEWMTIAEREAALPEHERSAWPDPGENPRILEYFRVAASWFEPGEGDETDWCAAFVNFCLVTSGHVGTDHPGARSFFWNKKGQFVRLDKPQRGAIAVRRYAPFDDDKWATGPGHVGFVTSASSTDVTLLGGNQSQTIRLQTFPLEAHDDSGKLTAKFIAFMMPVMN